MMVIKTALELATSVEHNYIRDWLSTQTPLESCRPSNKEIRSQGLNYGTSGLADFPKSVQARPQGCGLIRLGTRTSGHREKRTGRSPRSLSQTRSSSQLLYNRTTVEMSLNLEYGETQTTYRNHFLRKWQKELETSNTGAYIPRDRITRGSLGQAYKDEKRRKEVAISKLCFGHYLLNEQLHRW